MIVVTGGAGFIGSNLIKGLNAKGTSNILIVDDLKDARKFKNIVGLDFIDIMPVDVFLGKRDQYLPKKGTIFHLGAITDTMETHGDMVMAYNHMYSESIAITAMDKEASFIYASSAAVYGNNGIPLNIYGYSKYLFDKFVLRRLNTAKRNKLIGLRYFNVYGPNEVHKDNMASVIYQFIRLKLDGKLIKLFEGSDEFYRDFIHVDDVVKITLFMYDKNIENGIYDCGTGISTSFQDIADIVNNLLNSNNWIQDKPFPEGLREQYQTNTRADMAPIRKSKDIGQFIPVEEGIRSYYEIIKENGGYNGKVA
jgi:ADP-L-glycero-D-manno-heptose 6-epimerase